MLGIFIISDVRLYREGLAGVLSREPGMEVRGSAAHATTALAALTNTAPDVVLIDISAPDAMPAIRAVRERLPKLRVIALAVSGAEDVVVECARAGIAGYVDRDGSLEDLRRTIEQVAREEFQCSPRVAGAILRELQRLSASGLQGTDQAGLTPREMAVLRLVDEGLSNKEIAARLHIQISTAKNHVHNALEKLQVHHRREAAAKLRAAGRLQLPGVRRAE